MTLLVGDSGTDEKTGGGDGGGRFSVGVTRMDKIRNERGSTGGKVWRENARGKTEMVWTPERRWVYPYY